jgi:hypothetical protein
MHIQANKTHRITTELVTTPTAHTALTIQHLLINLAIQHTHTFTPWQTVHNFFIEKIPGKPLIDKLRVIHIYEADWNIILKYFVAHTRSSNPDREQGTPWQDGDL